MGSFNGHTFEGKLNPAMASTGQTTIQELPGSEFRVSSFFDVFAELSIDGGPFVPGPVRRADLTGAIPEPASLTLGLLGRGAAILFNQLRRDCGGA